MFFLEKFNIKISNKELLKTALTHSSFTKGHKEAHNYERLAFLCDAVFQSFLTV